jgi:hypothetical protein
LVYDKPRPELASVGGSSAAAGGAARSAQHVALNHSVLMIHQKRGVHEEIPEMIRRVEHGDSLIDEKEQAIHGGMGGFGGGFFSVPSAVPTDK